MSNKNKINSFIVNKIKEYRKEANMQQNIIADILGISRVAYINIEKERQYMSIDKVYILACVYKKQISDFFPPLINIEPEIQIVEDIEIKRIKRITKNAKSIIL